MKKSSYLLTATLFAVSSLSACMSSPNVQTKIVQSDIQYVKLNTNGNSSQNIDQTKPVEYIADIAEATNGPKTGISFSVTINPPKDTFKIKANANGKTSADLKSFRVNLTSSNTLPLTNRSTVHGFVLNRTVSGTGPSSYTVSSKVTFTNVPAGTWFATSTADYAASLPATLSAPIATNYVAEGFITPDNSGTAYSGADAGAKIAVSTNSATVTPALALSFSDAQPLATGSLTLNMNVQNIGANVDTTITPTDVAVGALGAS